MKKEKEREREADFSLPFITVPYFPLCSLPEHPTSLYIKVLWCMVHCADIVLLVAHVVLSQFKRADTGLRRLTALGMTALPDSLTVRHPVICVVRMSNTLSSQQKYLGREAFLEVGARLSCMSTLNFAVRCEPG